MQGRDAWGRRRTLAASASVVLAAVIGVMAIYAATSSVGRDGDPITAAAPVASSTPASTPDPTPIPTLAPTPVPTPVADAQTAQAAETTQAAETAEPEVEPEPEEAAPTSEPEEAEAITSTVAAASIAGEIETLADVDDRDATEATTKKEASLKRSGWICDGAVQLEDPRGRNWSLGRVSFVEGPGYERVVLHIDRLGPGTGENPTVTAEAFATSRVRDAIGVRTPSLGQTTVSLHLAGGIEGNLGLRGYRPSGLRSLREFSVYPAARGSSRVLISVPADKCFRLRVPAWTASGPNTRQAQILLDIKS